MDLLSVFLIGIGLSVDSLAASVTTGVCMRRVKLKNVLKIAMFMAVFQGGMPFIGWLAGSSFKKYIESFDHWLAFFLLLAIGGKMIYEGLRGNEDEEKCFCPSNNLLLAGMSLATSIDALIVGIGFGILEVAILVPVAVIGGVTFLFSFAGVWIGNKIGNRYNSGLEVLGGVVLALLGIKILIEHLYF